jgi:hypothetical protein
VFFTHFRDAFSATTDFAPTRILVSKADLYNALFALQKALPEATDEERLLVPEEKAPVAASKAKRKREARDEGGASSPEEAASSAMGSRPMAQELCLDHRVGL